MRSAIVLCLLAALLAGCSGVILNAEYSQLLDKTAAWSAQVSTDADANQFSPAEIKTALRLSAKHWSSFRDGRDGVKGKVSP